MFKRKLIALDYHNAESFDIKDESQFRNLMVWLEDQKIRHYPIDDRAGLRNIVAGDWEKSFHQYLDDLSSPANKADKAALVDWILGYAIRLEYGENVDKYNGLSAGNKPSGDATSTNPLDTMDFNSPDFKAGVISISQMLQIPPHSDHEVVLKAVCLLVRERLSKDALEKEQKKIASQKTNKTKQDAVSLPLDKLDLGFETADYISTEAAKILRLLHIRELRELQTKINRAIVMVQALTANPKTDTKLGKVGRK